MVQSTQRLQRSLLWHNLKELIDFSELSTPVDVIFWPFWKCAYPSFRPNFSSTLNPMIINVMEVTGHEPDFTAQEPWSTSSPAYMSWNHDNVRTITLSSSLIILFPFINFFPLFTFKTNRCKQFHWNISLLVSPTYQFNCEYNTTTTRFSKWLINCIWH